MNKLCQTTVSVAFSLVMGIFVQVPALALDPPGTAEITSALGEELPAYWSISAAEILATVNDGDEVSPRYRQRFVADAATEEDLYLPAADSETVGPFTVLVTTRTATQVHRLYGIATSTQALGKWSTELIMENSVRGLGIPRSLFGRPVVVAGSDRAGQVSADLLKAQELIKTAKEGIARASTNADTLQRLAAEEKEALETANRSRLEALKARYEQERATIAAGADRERNRLVGENQRRLDALMAKHEQERAAATATAETLKAVSEAEAETTAQKKLAPALVALAEERKRTTEIAELVVAAEMKEKTARYDALLAGLRSANISQRNATFDLALASADEHLKTTAITEAMKSGDDGLQAKALAVLITKSPRIGITVRTKNGEDGWDQLLEVTSLDEKTLTFSGKYYTRAGRDPEESNGTGSVQRDRLSLSGHWRATYNFNCTVNAEVDGKGVLSGSISCGNNFVGQVEIHL